MHSTTVHWASLHFIRYSGYWEEVVTYGPDLNPQGTYVLIQVGGKEYKT